MGGDSLIAAAILIVLASAFRAISKSWDGDFKRHWEFGRRFLAGEFLYTGGHDLPYPPFWGTAHAPAALFAMPIAKALLFPIGIAALALLLGTLRRLAAPAFSLDRTRAFWLPALAMVLAGRYVIRDLAELGVNTALVALSWLAIYLWTQRRDLLAGTSLGMAIALKCTPSRSSWLILPGNANGEWSRPRARRRRLFDARSHRLAGTGLLLGPHDDLVVERVARLRWRRSFGRGAGLDPLETWQSGPRSGALP